MSDKTLNLIKENLRVNSLKMLIAWRFWQIVNGIMDLYVRNAGIQISAMARLLIPAVVQGANMKNLHLPTLFFMDVRSL